MTPLLSLLSSEVRVGPLCYGLLDSIWTRLTVVAGVGAWRYTLELDKPEVPFRGVAFNLQGWVA